jgi:antitoxin Phd
VIFDFEKSSCRLEFDARSEEISVAQFSLTDLSNRPGEVVKAALQGPVEITRRGKRKLMLLTAADYDRLVSAADTRRAFHADDAPEEVAAMILTALAAEHS